MFTKTVVSTLLVALSIQVVLAHKGSWSSSSSSSSESHECICPNSKPKTNFKDPNEYTHAVRKMVGKLWNETYPSLSCDGARMKRAIMQMAESDSCMWNNQALTASAWIWSILPQINNNPSICGFARLANATVEYQKTKNPTVMTEALDWITKFIYNSAVNILKTSARNSGCKVPKKKITVPTCYAEGTVYSIKENWDQRGEEFPCSYGTAAMNMYKSKDKAEQIMAAVATASLAPDFGEIIKKFNNEIMFEILGTQTLGKIPKCCCKKFVRNLKHLTQKIKKDAERTVGLIKSKYPKKCH